MVFIHPSYPILSPCNSALRFLNIEESGKILNMASHNVKFATIRTVKKPTTVKFKTKSGKTVSFKAIRTVKREETVRFRAKKK